MQVAAATHDVTRHGAVNRRNVDADFLGRLDHNPDGPVFMDGRDHFLDHTGRLDNNATLHGLVARRDDPLLGARRCNHSRAGDRACHRRFDHAAQHFACMHFPALRRSCHDTTNAAAAINAVTLLPHDPFRLDHHGLGKSLELRRNDSDVGAFRLHHHPFLDRLIDGRDHAVAGFGPSDHHANGTVAIDGWPDLDALRCRRLQDLLGNSLRHDWRQHPREALAGAISWRILCSLRKCSVRKQACQKAKKQCAHGPTPKPSSDPYTAR